MANKYQEWLDANQDKAGTPDYETVRQAAEAEQDIAPVETQPEGMGWGDVAYEAVTNLPSSAFNIVQGVAHMAAHPLETLNSLNDVAGAALTSALNAIDPQIAKSIGLPERFNEVADNLAQFYGDRYGSLEGVKRAIAEDPAGVLADASTVMFGAGTALRAPGLARTPTRMAGAPTVGEAGKQIQQASQYVDPLGLTVSAVGAAPKAIESATTGVLGQTTGTGAEAVREAFQSGVAGGERGRAFRESMRGQVPMTEILDAARQGVAQMRANMQQRYQKSKDLFKDKTVLSFDAIDRAFDNSLRTFGLYKGQIKNQSAVDALMDAKAEIERWKSYPGSEYHTPEGMNALRESILAVKNKIDPNDRQANAAVQSVYASIRKTIDDQAPGYSQILRDYAEASELISDIERTFSLGAKTSDTAIRKLQSLMRNNVSTGYGRRMELAETLEREGGRSFLPMAAGQQMSSLTPRSISAIPSTAGAGYALGTGNLPLAAGVAAATSPRIVGEVAQKAGQLGNIATGGRLGRKGIVGLYDLLNTPGVANLLSQTGALEMRGLLGQ